MTIEVELPDGSIAEFPDGTSREVMKGAISRRFGPKPKTMEELTPGISTNPTDGTTGTQRFAAGAGKSLRDTGLGVTQFAARGGPMGWLMDAAGVESPISKWADERINANAVADTQLMDTGAGLGGNVAGTVAQMLAPAGALAGAARTQEFARAAPALQSIVRALMPTSVRGGVTQGTVLGATQPVADGQSRGLNALIGTGGGFVGGVLPRVLGASVRGVSRVLEPLTDKGAENVVGRTLQRFAANPSALQQLPDPVLGRAQAPGGPIVGGAPTLAEATLDPGIAQLQRMMTSKSPEVANALTTARQAANASRLSALQRFAGDPAKRQAALDSIEKAEKAAYGSLDEVDGIDVVPVVRSIDKIIAGPEGKRPAVRSTLTEVRKLFFEPYEDAARIKDARRIVDATLGSRMSSADDAALREARRLLSNRAGASADEVVEALSALNATSKTARTAIAEAAELVNSLNVAYENQAPRLLGARRAINDLISGKGDNRNGTLAMRELIAVRESLDEAIRKVAPQIDTALDARRKGMAPVNEMDAMQELLGRATADVSTPAGGIAPALRPAAFMRDGDNLEQMARAGTGFRKATDDVFSPKAQETIEGVRIGLARQQFADSAAKVPGSPTAQYLSGQNIADLIGGQKPGPANGLARLVAASLDKPYAFMGIPERLESVMARVLTDPGQAQAILARLPKPDRVLLEQAIGRATSPAGSAVAVGQNR
jgi:hypothetical protein